MHEGHSIKVILPKELAIGNTVYNHLFQGNQYCCVFSHPRKQSASLSLTTASSRTFSLSKSQCASTPLSFWLRLVVATYDVKQICKHFLIKTLSSIHITHSSVDFSWFSSVSRQKDEITDPYSCLEHSVHLPPFWIATKQIPNTFSW